MKKLLITAGTIILATSVATGAYLYYEDKEILIESDAKIEYLDKGKVTEKTIDPKEPKEGRLIYEGGPYKLGETIYVQGIGVELSAVGTKKNVLDIKGQEDRLFGIFHLDILNYNKSPYTLSSKEVVMEFDDEEGNHYIQPMEISGYDKWQRVKGSFQFGEIPTNTSRSGNIYIPMEETATKNGLIKIYINNVPITFTY